MREAVRDDFPFRVGMTLEQVRDVLRKHWQFEKENYAVLVDSVEVTEGHGRASVLIGSTLHRSLFWCDLTINQSNVASIWITFGTLELRYGPSLRLAGEGEHRKPAWPVQYAPEGSDPD